MKSLKIKEVILERITVAEVSKLNVMAFHLKVAEESSRVVLFDRVKARSAFHNSQDLQTGGFYKHTSLLIGTIYEK